MNFACFLLLRMSIAFMKHYVIIKSLLDSQRPSRWNTALFLVGHSDRLGGTRPRLQRLAMDQQREKFENKGKLAR